MQKPLTPGMEGPAGGDIARTGSRFQVARVNSQSDRRVSEDICVDVDDTPLSGPRSPGGVQFSLSSYDTSSKNYDSTNFTERLPRETYYRNMFSASAPGKLTRPTLPELHEKKNEFAYEGVVSRQGLSWLLKTECVAGNCHSVAQVPGTGKQCTICT